MDITCIKVVVISLFVFPKSSFSNSVTLVTNINTAYRGGVLEILAFAPLSTTISNIRWTINDVPLGQISDITYDLILMDTRFVTLAIRNVSTELNGHIVGCTAVLSMGMHVTCSPLQTIKVQGILGPVVNLTGQYNTMDNTINISWMPPAALTVPPAIKPEIFYCIEISSSINTEKIGCNVNVDMNENTSLVLRNVVHGIDYDITVMPFNRLGSGAAMMVPLPTFGTPPSFIQQPEDRVVHDKILQEFNGSMVNLVLHCRATGDPTPTVAWFRGNTDITEESITPGNGSIGLNVTEGEAGGAARTGTLYHCRATNTIGLNNVTATIRSRNASVSYAYFGGFRVSSRQVNVSTRIGRSVALECAVNTSNPPPEIQWMKRINGGPLQPVKLALNDPGPYIESVHGGRYLYFSAVTMADINATEYTCVVTNALALSMPVPSNRFYNIADNLANDSLAIFISLNQTREVSIGESLVLYVSAAYGTDDLSQAFNARCFAQGSGGQVELPGITSRRIYTVPDPPIHTFITCTGSAEGITQLTNRLNFTFVKAPMLSTSSSPIELIMRDILAGDSPLILNCESTGTPTPVITWFYNGVLLYGSMNGVTVNDTQVTIDNPEIHNSGVYQCFVFNGVSAPLIDVQRSYIVEITNPDIEMTSEFSSKQETYSPPSLSSLPYATTHNEIDITGFLHSNIEFIIGVLVACIVIISLIAFILLVALVIVLKQKKNITITSDQKDCNFNISRNQSYGTVAVKRTSSYELSDRTITGSTQPQDNQNEEY